MATDEPIVNEVEEEEEEEERRSHRQDERRGCSCLFPIFLLIVIAFCFVLGYTIRLYFSKPEERQGFTESSVGETLGVIEKKWRENDLPLDIQSFTLLMKNMRADLENEKLPQLRERLEQLRDKITARRDEAVPEMKDKWEALSGKVNDLLEKAREKTEGLSDSLSDIQDETTTLLKEEDALKKKVMGKKNGEVKQNDKKNDEVQEQEAPN